MSEVNNLFKQQPTPANVAREYGNPELEGFLSAIFPACAEDGVDVDTGETVKQDLNNERQTPQETSPIQSPSPEVDEEFDITGLASNDIGGEGGRVADGRGGLGRPSLQFAGPARCTSWSSGRCSN